MENIFDKFKKLNLDTSPIGLSIEFGEPFVCTPIGAQIIGWDNRIHYCFIKGFKEIVFCVNPETCCNYYVYPLAKDFTDFLRLLLSLKTTNAIQQVVWMDKDAFENSETEDFARIKEQIEIDITRAEDVCENSKQVIFLPRLNKSNCIKVEKIEKEN